MRAQTTHRPTSNWIKTCLLIFPVLYQNHQNSESFQPELEIDDLEISEEEIS